MQKKILLTGIMFLGIGLVGCQSDVSETQKVEYSDDVKKVNKKSDSLRISYSEFKIDMPEYWEKSKVDDIDIFKIPEREANISIKSIKNVNLTLDSYIEKVKLYIESNLNVTDIEEELIEVDKNQLKSLMYNCNINENDSIYVYQTSMKIDQNIYVFTLVSNEEDHGKDVDTLKQVLETIKKY